MTAAVKAAVVTSIPVCSKKLCLENQRILTYREAKLHARKVVKELGVTDGLIYLPGEPTRLYEDSDQSPPFKQRR
jgi:hypothetical protein